MNQLIDLRSIKCYNILDFERKRQKTEVFS